MVSGRGLTLFNSHEKSLSKIGGNLACVAGGFGGRESRAKTQNKWCSCGGNGARTATIAAKPRQRASPRGFSLPSPHFPAASPLVLALVPGFPVKSHLQWQIHPSEVDTS